MKKETYLALLIVFITIILYLPALQNGFVNWDDEAYVVDNLVIRSLDVHFFKWAFFEFAASNWHPLTWISHAIDYALWGLNPLGHHLTSIILHGLNTLLVVLLTLKLLSRIRQNQVLLPAAITGLLFGIHPLHVESVAWISERKDVLYAFFYLLSLLSYVKYLDSMKKKDGETAIFGIYLNYRYLVTLAFFVFSLLSKPMAITLPVVLLILDWYPYGRFEAKKDLKSIVFEKIPFILLSLFSGIVTLTAQNSESFHTVSLEKLPLLTRILVAFKAIFLYIANFSYPFNLVPLYEYPRDVSFLSPGYLGPIFLFICITASCTLLLKSKKYIMAGWAFYVVSLLPVLGFIQVGRQPMADRYVYLALLGPTVLIGLLIDCIYKKLTHQRYTWLLRTALLSCLLLIFGGLTYASMQQMHIWKNGVTLWTYEINAEPQFPEAYQRRANAFRKQASFAEAIKDYTTAISLNPFSEPDYYNDRGICYANLGLFKEALKDFDTAVFMNPENSVYRKNRESALKDMERLREKKGKGY